MTGAEGAGRPGLRRILIVGLLLSALLAGLVSVVASSHPDGLEYVAHTLGFGSQAQDHAFADSPLADYQVSALGSGGLSTGLSGLIGLLVVAVLAFGLMRLLRRPSRDNSP